MKFVIGIAMALPIWANAQCSSSSIFFSEYIEGTGNNKAIEIFNGTTNEIDLADYKVEIYFNGNTSPAHTKYLIGKLTSGKVHVIALNHTSDATLASQANQTDTYPFSWFNGNDALVLKDVNTDVVMDVIGEIGVDPGEAWEVGTGTTKDQTLIRKSHILTGNTDWQNGKGEWDTLPLDYFNDLGSHTFDCALPVSFVDFSVKTKNDIVELSWVSNGSDAGNYLILHSDDGLKFNRVGSIPGYAGSSLSNYKYAHLNPSGGMNYYQIVFDSFIGSTVSTFIATIEVELSEIRVNYNQGDCFLNVEFTDNSGGEILVFDSNGRQLLYFVSSSRYNQISLVAFRASPLFYIKAIKGVKMKSLTVVK